MAEVDNTVQCECCGEETDISYERTQFLRWMLDNNHIFKGHYMQVVDKLELPDPERMEREKRKELLGKLFTLNEELRDIEDEDTIQKLKAKKKRIREQLQNNFNPELGTEQGEFDINSL